jgi:CDP-diacylglycerol--serine O-phosphatidyltransferase
MEAYDIRGLPWLAWLLALITGFTMVSNIRFYSGKEINLRKAVPFRVVVLIAFSVVIIVQMADNLPELLFAVFLLYVLSGYAMWVSRLMKRRGKSPVPPRKEPGSGPPD